MGCKPTLIDLPVDILHRVLNYTLPRTLRPSASSELSPYHHDVIPVRWRYYGTPFRISEYSEASLRYLLQHLMRFARVSKQLYKAVISYMDERRITLTGSANKLTFGWGCVSEAHLDCCPINSFCTWSIPVRVLDISGYRFDLSLNAQAALRDCMMRVQDTLETFAVRFDDCLASIVEGIEFSCLKSIVILFSRFNHDDASAFRELMFIFATSGAKDGIPTIRSLHLIVNTFEINFLKLQYSAGLFTVLDDYLRELFIDIRKFEDLTERLQWRAGCNEDETPLGIPVLRILRTLQSRIVMWKRGRVSAAQILAIDDAQLTVADIFDHSSEYVVSAKSLKMFGQAPNLASLCIPLDLCGLRELHGVGLQCKSLQVLHIECNLNCCSVREFWLELVHALSEMKELQDFALKLRIHFEHENFAEFDLHTVAGHLESILIRLGENLRSFRVDSNHGSFEDELEVLTQLYATAAKHNKNLREFYVVLNCARRWPLFDFCEDDAMSSVVSCPMDEFIAGRQALVRSAKNLYLIS